MVVALMLSLPVEMVFGDPNIHHRYLGPILPHSTCNFFRLDTLGATYLRNDFIYLVSGTVDWFLSLRLHLRDLSNVLWFAEQPLRGRSSRSMLRGLSKAESVCSEFGLTPVRFVHHMYGGATNAVHLVGFSQVFGFESAPFPHPLSVSRSIRHHWKSAVPLRHPIRVCCRLPAVVGDHKRPLIVNNMLRVEGLLPVDSPISLCAALPCSILRISYNELYLERSFWRYMMCHWGWSMPYWSTQFGPRPLPCPSNPPFLRLLPLISSELFGVILGGFW